MKVTKILVLSVLPMLLSACGGAGEDAGDDEVKEFKEAYASLLNDIDNYNHIYFTAKDRAFRVNKGQKEDEPYIEGSNEMYMTTNSAELGKSFYAYDNTWLFDKFAYKHDTKTTYIFDANYNVYNESTNPADDFDYEAEAGTGTAYKILLKLTKEFAYDGPANNYKNYKNEEGNISFKHGDYEVEAKIDNSKLTNILFRETNDSYVEEWLYENIEYNVLEIPEYFDFPVVA